MAIAVGINKSLRFKRETSFATAPGVSGAQELRRTESTLDLEKATFQSNELNASRQVRDFRHGLRTVPGSINGELSPGTYADFQSAILRRDFTAGVSSGALTIVAATSSAPHFTRSSGSWITDGFKTGDVIRFTGWTAGATNNNARNYRVIAISADGAGLTVRDIGASTATVAAKAAGDSVTASVVGKKTFIPQTGHTDVSYAIEHWFSDIGRSERFGGMKPSQMEFNLAGSGLATVKTSFMGKSFTADTSAYFTSPAAQTTSGIEAAVNGSLSIGGGDIAVVTGLTITVNANMTNAEATVGSNEVAGVFPGRIQVSGQLTAYFTDGTLADYFEREDEIALDAWFTTSNAANADFQRFSLPRVKLGGNKKSDGDKGIIQTIPYQALELVGATTADPTTLVLQDSLA